MSGISATFLSVALLAIVGVAVGVGARYARHKGHLQSKGARYVVLAVILIIAAALWLGPAMFLATGGEG
jgi:hypothetical protein